MSFHVEVSRVIWKTADEIWTVLTDTARFPTLQQEFSELRGEMGQGAELVLVPNLRGRQRHRLTFKTTVTVFDPPRRMEWRSHAMLGLLRGTRTVTLEPRGADATRVVVREAFAGLLAITVRVQARSLREGLRIFLDNLALALE